MTHAIYAMLLAITALLFFGLGAKWMRERHELDNSRGWVRGLLQQQPTEKTP